LNRCGRGGPLQLMQLESFRGTCTPPAETTSCALCVHPQQCVLRSHATETRSGARIMPTVQLASWDEASMHGGESLAGWRQIIERACCVTHSRLELATPREWCALWPSHTPAHPVGQPANLNKATEQDVNGGVERPGASTSARDARTRARPCRLDFKRKLCWNQTDVAILKFRPKNTVS
jgi:hypothetical protein